MEAVTNWIAWHKDAMILTAVCGVILATTYVLTEYAWKRVLKIPYK